MLLAIPRTSRTCALLVWSLAACTSPEPDRAAPAAPASPGIRLSSQARTPHDVELTWSDPDTRAAGHILEFATEPDGQYTTLEFLPPRRTTFVHDSLMPDTTFYYRVRPYHGPASAPVEINLPAPPPGEDIDKDRHEWAVPTARAQPAGVRPASIRGANDGPDAAPTDFQGKVMHSMGILFTWTDRASDEDGYLLEVKADGAADYSVAALLDPDVNSFGLITLPSEKRAAFRVRAVHFGPPSNLVHEKTGPEATGTPSPRN